LNGDTEWKISRGKYQHGWEDTFNWKLKKYVANVWIGSIWLMIGYNGEISKNGYGIVISVECARIFWMATKK